MKPLLILLYTFIVSSLFFLTGCQTTRQQRTNAEPLEAKTFYCYNVTTYSQSFSPKGATNQTTLRTTRRVCKEAGEATAIPAGQTAEVERRCVPVGSPG